MNRVWELLKIFMSTNGEIWLALLLSALLGLATNCPWAMALQKGLGWLAKKIRRLVQQRQGSYRQGGGLLFTLLFGLGVGLLFYLVSVLAEWRLPGLGAFVSHVLLLTLSLSVGQIARMAFDVRGKLRKDDVENARRTLARWSGQDTEKMTPKGMYRLCCETLAKRTLYEVLCPLFCWGFARLMNSPDLAVLFVWFYMGAMGAERCAQPSGALYGRFSVVNYIAYLPARLFAWILLGASFLFGKNGRSAYMLLLQDSGKYPDQNEGVLLAVLSGALGLRFGGGGYVQGAWRPAGEIGFDLNRPDESAVLSALLMLFAAELLFAVVVTFFYRFLSILCLAATLLILLGRFRMMRR